MRYDAVLAYADETYLSYSSFRLLEQLVPSPVNETAMPPSSESKNCKGHIKTKPENWIVLKMVKMEEPLNPFHIPVSLKSFQ